MLYFARMLDKARLHHAGELRSYAESRRPAPDAPSRVGREHAEAFRHARCHIADVGHLREIDPHRAMSGGSHRGDVGVEQARLAEAARRRESDGHAVSGRALQRVELHTAIDERVRRHGSLVTERIHRTSLYAIAAQNDRGTLTGARRP